MLLRGLELGRDGLGVAALDGLLAGEDLRADLGIDRRGGLAVFAAAVSLDLGADVLVALAREHVLHGLRADELARRGDERRIAHVLADARRLKQCLVELVDLAEHLQLAQQVREHAARDLIGQALGVGGHGDRVERAVGEVLRADGLEEVRDLEDTVTGIGVAKGDMVNAGDTLVVIG